MKNEKKNFKKTALLTGVLFTGSVAGLSGANTESAKLFEYSALGSAGELRNELIDLNHSAMASMDARIGNKTAKFSEMKCGEGKCGEGHSDDEKTKDTKKSDKKADAKSDDKKADSEKKTEAKKEDKTSESKCGEGKCG